MARGRKGTRPPISTGRERDRQGLRPWMARFLEWMRVRNYTERTVVTYQAALARFAEWAEARDVRRPGEVDRAEMERYQKHLFYRRTSRAKPLSYSSQLGLLAPVRTYFKWLARQGVVKVNPALDLELPRREVRLPPSVLTPSQAESVLAQAEVKTVLGLRDRALLEVLWATGMRRAELAGLRLQSVSLERGTVTIRKGKGKKDRVVPLGKRASEWVERYLREVRPRLEQAEDDGTLFVSVTGRAFHPDEVSQLVARHVRAAGIEAGRATCSGTAWRRGCWRTERT